MKIPGKVILSRPDNLGDAVLTLPMAGWIKHHAPGTRIIAVVKQYTAPLWAHCHHVDEVITLEELRSVGAAKAAQCLRATRAGALVHVFPQKQVAAWAKAAKIPVRIGTSHRWWHWTTCNKRVNFSRRNSHLHEAELNIRLLAPFHMPMPAGPEALVPFYGLQLPTPGPAVRELLRPGRKNIILHPMKVTGAAWGLKNFAELIRLLDPARHHVLLTGTAKEAEQYRAVLPVGLPHVTDTGGTLGLEELMALIGACDALVAASTGPLHMAAAGGIRAIGLFNMRKPLHPGRWAPLGRDAHVLVQDPDCVRCAAGKPCDCITWIDPRRVLALLP